MSRKSRQTSKKKSKRTGKDDNLFQVFKEELVRFFNENESLIPATPLVEEHAVPLMELYVQPPISAFVRPNAFGQGHKHSDKTQVLSYRQLFFNDRNVPYKNIYVEAKAGCGKTSFTQKVAMTWCQASTQNTTTESPFEQTDVDTLKHFDLLFLLHLRDFQGEEICLLDDLILQFITQSLPEAKRFSEKFVKRILRTRPCLILLDGLDEWTHPRGKCVGKPGIPHNNYGKNCTILTTSRPWKISTIRLTPNLIDQHVEIFELDHTSSQKLKSNAVKFLSKNRGQQKPDDVTDFDKQISLVKLRDLCCIPYILLQLICIWFDGLSIGKSRCDTYSKTIELTLERGLMKTNVGTLFTVNSNQNAPVPECIRHNKLCNQYMNFLLKLGNLSFYTLFQEINESSLIIESTTVLKFLTEQDLEFGLIIGLLNQTKDRRMTSVKRYKVFFQHKSLQEFMAALYITSEFKNEIITLTILETSSSLSNILDMSNTFIFVCGINPEVYTHISVKLQEIVERDCITCRYRTYLYNDDDQCSYDDRRTMGSYQSMQVSCFQESARNGNASCFIPLHDILLNASLTEDDLIALKAIIRFNKGNLKSLYMSSDDKRAAFIQLLDSSMFNALEIVRVADCRTEPVWLAKLITELAGTLKCLALAGFVRYISLSDITITPISGLTCLQSLYLDHITMTDRNLERLYAYISQTTTLKQLKLKLIHCSDHEHTYHDCVVSLDLHRLNELTMLQLVILPCRELRINSACLMKLEFWPREKMNASTSAVLWEDLRNARVLSTIELHDITYIQEAIQNVRTLTQLQNLMLARIDIVDRISRFSLAMTQLERVELEEVTMSYGAWKTMFISICKLSRPITVKLTWITMTFKEWKELLLCIGEGPQAVTVELNSCWGPSRKYWMNIVAVIKSKPELSLLQDLHFPCGGSASLTLKTNIKA